MSNVASQVSVQNILTLGLALTNVKETQNYLRDTAKLAEDVAGILAGGKPFNDGPTENAARDPSGLIDTLNYETNQLIPETRRIYDALERIRSRIG